MIDAIFYLAMNALFFLGIVGAAFLVFLPIIKYFERGNEGKGMDDGDECLNCAE